MYVDVDNKCAEQNYDTPATCILASVFPGTRAELHAICDYFKIGGMVYDELVFKVLMNKDISDNKQTTRYLQYQYKNLLSCMTTCASDIAKFILEWRSVVSFLESLGVVLTYKLIIL